MRLGRIIHATRRAISTSTTATPAMIHGIQGGRGCCPTGGYPAAVCAVQALPSQKRCSGAPDGSGYQPGGTDRKPGAGFMTAMIGGFGNEAGYGAFS